MVFNCIRENTSSANQTNDAKVEQIKNWESEKKDEFISNINIEDINELALLLNNLSEQDSGVVENSSVNDMMNKIGSLLTNFAKTTFGTFVPGRHSKKETNKKHKPWFDAECREARQKCRCSKRKLKFNRTVPQLEQTKFLEKKYKKVMDRCIRKHRKK
jgi:hypothetical protein